MHWDSSHECPVDSSGWGLDLFTRADMATSVKIVKIPWETIKRKNGEGQRKAKAIYRLPSDAFKNRPE